MKFEFETFHKSEIMRDHLRLGGENPKHEKIEVNSLYLEKNGQPILPVMGEYHFSRADRKDWKQELAKIKAGGRGRLEAAL